MLPDQKPGESFNAWLSRCANDPLVSTDELLLACVAKDMGVLPAGAGVTVMTAREIDDE